MQTFFRQHEDSLKMLYSKCHEKAHRFENNAEMIASCAEVIAGCAEVAESSIAQRKNKAEFQGRIAQWRL